MHILAVDDENIALDELTRKIRLTGLTDNVVGFTRYDANTA